jgi:predicted N-acetyltransferase YhbS
VTVEIRALAPKDERRSFRSGDAALDLYFHRYAGQNQFRHHIGVTYVAVAGPAIVGFVTVSVASLDAEDLPSGRKMPPYPLPVLRVARLASHEAVRGQGIGKALLRFCIELAERLRDEVGCVGLLVDAKPGAEPFYQPFGFTPVEAHSGQNRSRPAATMLYLPLGSVPARRT